MKNFSSFITEAETSKTKVNDTLRTAFGRHQGLHSGHGESLLYGMNQEGGKDVDKKLYTSRTQDPKKNPLSREFKERHLQMAIPETQGMWDSDPRVRTPIDVMNKAHDEDGYQNFQAVVGPDRVESFKKLLRGNNPGFKNVDVITDSTMIRDPDMLRSGEGEGEMNPEQLRRRFLAALSGSRQRKLAMEGDYDRFAEGMDFGDHYGKEQITEYFDELRRAMNSNNTPQTRQLDNEFEWEDDREYIGEMYRTGKLYYKGDVVYNKMTEQVGTIHHCGANHIICLTEEGEMFKSFIHDVVQL